MSDLISRSKLQFAIKRNQTIMRDGEHYIRLSAVLEKLRIAPAVDAVPVVHGRWEYNPGDNIPYCSNCAMPQDVPTNYCHGCGAKMDAKEEN